MHVCEEEGGGEGRGRHTSTDELVKPPSRCRVARPVVVFYGDKHTVILSFLLIPRIIFGRLTPHFLVS